ncbi:MAG: hypothetical protein F6J94_02835 [Moorea sp. SIO1F2]|nr:hypothetical protein [Moorena sp. SIO1F2]NET80949.1 hypothetical protein [Moorena sp. SIO1F2]
MIQLNKLKITLIYETSSNRSLRGYSVSRQPSAVSRQLKAHATQTA